MAETVYRPNCVRYAVADRVTLGFFPLRISEKMSVSRSDCSISCRREKDDARVPKAPLRSPDLAPRTLDPSDPITDRYIQSPARQLFAPATRPPQPSPAGLRV